MLRTRLLETIAAEGPMPFERFMEAALYDPEGGFFGSGPLRSAASGDFLTSPEVSPWFGRMLANAVAPVIASLGGSARLVEIGAGSGSLLRALLDALPSRPSEVIAVEASPAARDALRDVADRVVGSIDQLPDRFRGVVVANELLDNLPVAVAVRAGDGWEERFVGGEDGALMMVPVPARPEVAAWAESYGGDVPEGGIVEVQLAALEFVSKLFRRIEAGAVILADYGGTAEELAPRRTSGTLRTYRAHHLGPDPLAEPGATDITVDVNFTPIVEVGRELGWDVRLVRQDDFLAEHGLRDVLRDLRERELALARAGEAMPRLATRSELRDAETLMHPRGLGDFRIVHATRPVHTRRDRSTGIEVERRG